MTSFKVTPVNFSLMHSLVSSQMRAVFGGKGAKFTFEFLFISVHSLVLVQCVFVTKRFFTDITDKLLLTVIFLVFLQVVYGLGAKVAIIFLAAEGHVI